MLYVTAPQILYDYFPFGSGFASYGTYSSGVYYSKIYSDYGIDGIWGMTKSYYNFIADTFYPSLAQFGVIGVCLFFIFWVYIVKRAYTYYKKNGDNHAQRGICKRDINSVYIKRNNSFYFIQLNEI